MYKKYITRITTEIIYERRQRVKVTAVYCSKTLCIGLLAT